MFKVGDYVRWAHYVTILRIPEVGRLLVSAVALESGRVLTLDPHFLRQLSPHEVARIKLREAASAEKD